MSGGKGARHFFARQPGTHKGCHYISLAACKNLTATYGEKYPWQRLICTVCYDYQQCFGCDLRKRLKLRKDRLKHCGSIRRMHHTTVYQDILCNVGKGWYSTSICRERSQPFWTHCTFGWSWKGEADCTSPPHDETPPEVERFPAGVRRSV